MQCQSDPSQVGLLLAFRVSPGAPLRSRRRCRCANGNHEQQIDKLRVTGLASLVDVVCTSEDIGVTKPDPRAFEILASRLGCTPSEMLFIGDDLTLDVTAARAAGVAAAQVRRDRDGPTALGEAVRSATL